MCYVRSRWAENNNRTIIHFVYYVRSDMLDFKPGNNYFCDAFGGVVLYVSRRTASAVECCFLSCRAINDYGVCPLRVAVVLSVKRAAISRCEFVEYFYQGKIISFFASERCREFTLADFRDNFVNYTPF